MLRWNTALCLAAARHANSFNQLASFQQYVLQVKGFITKLRKNFRVSLTYYWSRRRK